MASLPFWRRKPTPAANGPAMFECRHPATSRPPVSPAGQWFNGLSMWGYSRPWSSVSGEFAEWRRIAYIDSACAFSPSLGDPGALRCELVDETRPGLRAAARSSGGSRAEQPSMASGCRHRNRRARLQPWGFALRARLTPRSTDTALPATSRRPLRQGRLGQIAGAAEAVRRRRIENGARDPRPPFCIGVSGLVHNTDQRRPGWLGQDLHSWDRVS